MALANSEHDLMQNIYRQERVSQQYAKVLQEEEHLSADKEFANAIEASSKQHDIESTNRQLDESLTREQQRKSAMERNKGSWDCIQCTFTNMPYKQHCEMCQAAPPPQILTYSPLCPLRFGVEIEILLPNGKDAFDFQSIAYQLTNLGSTPVIVRGTHQWNSKSLKQPTANGGEPLCKRCKYSDNEETTSSKYFWKLVKDSSLKVELPNDLCFELVSPILQGENGLKEVRVLMENLRKLGIATNQSCGFHVHVDATYSSSKDPDSKQAIMAMGTLQGIQNVVCCFLALESAFDLFVGLSWDKNEHHRKANQNKYCKSNRLKLGQVSNRQRWDKIVGTRNFTQLVHLASPDRYHKLNLTNIIDRHRSSTCEFRCHGGVENLEEAEAWIRLLLRFCEQASNSSTMDQCCLLPQGSTPKDEVRALFQLLDCAGLEQYFFVERRLFSEDRMVNPWTCNICHKVFQDSRALSQHCEATNHNAEQGRPKGI
eukprot:CAMPEP_0194255458 /NCGR_PEP_ID=MMETSP0158-20130606/34457_1 /TAXON_ID=33649 /ORGANISM="Thalassionema nitzschioides, Strain L26-B" /LENGTH=484 /DNA_ID=CAMNT_0038993819 /DNA_START=125 /DNA_END=1579 /DNA_ORIENTATION=-